MTPGERDRRGQELEAIRADMAGLTKEWQLVEGEESEMPPSVSRRLCQLQRAYDRLAAGGESS